LVISAAAQATASSGRMPWIALANMSTMMYFDSASVALRLGGPA